MGPKLPYREPLRIRNPMVFKELRDLEYLARGVWAIKPRYIEFEFVGWGCLGVVRRISGGGWRRRRVGFKGDDTIDKVIKLVGNVKMARGEFHDCLLKSIKRLGASGFSHGNWAQWKHQVAMTLRSRLEFEDLAPPRRKGKEGKFVLLILPFPNYIHFYL